jgi:integrase
LPTIRISKRTVDALAPASKAFVSYDLDLKGFGVRVWPSGVKKWIVEYRPGAGGRRTAKRRVTLGSVTALTPDQARRAAADLLANVRLGKDPAQDRQKARQTPTLSAVIQRYLTEEVEPKRKSGTAVLYRDYLTRLVQPELGAVRVTEVSRSDVARLHREIGATRPVTANRVLATLSGVFAFAAREELVPAAFNPTRGIEAFREQARERFLTTDELERLGSAIREAESVGIEWSPGKGDSKSKHAPKRPENRRTVIGPHAAAALRLLIFTGARLREVLHLRWQEVDLQRGLIFLPDSKTGAKPLVLNAPALRVLAEVPRTESDFVIAGEDPSRPRSDLKRPWALVSKRAGLDGVRLHDLRHTYASYGAGAGLGLPIIGKLLGHKQASTTERYAHLHADPLRRASEHIAGTIEAAMSQRTEAE